MNSCVFVGNLANEPMFYEGDVSRTIFTLAVDREGKDKNGMKRADFFNFVAWRSTADFVHKYCHKGDAIVVKTEARNKEFVNQAGERVKDVEFQVDSVNIVRRAKPKE